MPTAPATIVRTKRSCPGTSTTPTVSPVGSERCAKPSSMVMRGSFSSLRRSVSMPVSRVHQRRLAVVDVTGVPMTPRERRAHEGTLLERRAQRQAEPDRRRRRLAVDAAQARQQIEELLLVRARR